MLCKALQKVEYADGRKSTAEISKIGRWERLFSDNDASRKKDWKPVDHEFYELTFMQLPSQVWYDSLTNYQKGKWNHIQTNYPGPSMGDPWGIVTTRMRNHAGAAIGKSLPDWDTVAQAAVPSLRNEFNTINALLEFDDIPKLFKSIPDKGRFLKRFASDLRRGKIYERSGRQGIDSFLEYNLGVVPLVADAETLKQNLLDFFDEASKRARKIERARRRIRKGINASVVRDNAQAGIEYTDKLFGSPSGFDMSCWEFSAVYNVQVRDHITVAGSYASSNPLAWALDNAGLYPDLHTLWNGLPFSFLVDYVIPVGDTLESRFGSWSWQQLLDDGPGLRVIRAMTSVKVTCAFTYTYYPYGNKPAKSPSSGNWVRPVRPAIFKGKAKLYRRFLQDAVLDGVDVPLGTDSSSMNRRAAIASGILLNGFTAGRR